jgi:hypothetical protein
MSEREPEPAPDGYMMNAVGFAVDEDGSAIFGEVLDAGWVPTIDAPPPKPVEPTGGWPEGTRMINGRPFLPHDPSRRARPVSGLSRHSFTRSRLRIRVRRGRAVRPSRSRVANRSSAASRDGPSDESEGDPELPRSPDAADDLERLPSAVQHARWAARPLR